MEVIKKTLRESASARWIVLILVSFAMLTGYYFADVMSPIKTMLQNPSNPIPMLKAQADGIWAENSSFGLYYGAYSWFSVFFIMLIIGGIILDKLGIRFTGITFASLMLVGAGLNYYALTDSFIEGGFGYDFLNSFLVNYHPSVKLAALGFAVFGVGIEIVGVTASRIIVKWFQGKELALAMGLQVAIARMGTAAVLFFAPRIAGIDEVVTRPIAFGLIIIIIGLLSFIIYSMMDVKLDRQDSSTKPEQAEEEFKLRDLSKLITNKSFIYICLLCVLFYSAVFPFLKYAGDFMVHKFASDPTEAGDIPSILPFGTMILTPIFGYFLDKKGKGASIMIYGSILLILVHLGFALGPGGADARPLAYTLMILLGIAFSLVPASMWPAIPKIVDERYLGTAYSFIFWVQNIGLWGVPMLIGYVLDEVNPGVTEQIQNNVVGASYDYTYPMLIFALTGILGLGFAFLLKRDDKKMGFGLELPNIKK